MLLTTVGSTFRETFQAAEPRRAAVIALLAFVLYAPAAHWGLPDGGAADRIAAWGVDDEAPMGSLGQLHGIVRDNPGSNLGYPLMHPILVGVASAPYLLYRYVAGDLRPVRAEYPFGFGDPRRALRFLAWFAHLLSALLGAGVVVAAYVTGATWWDERAGLWSAGFMLVCYPMFYYARTANVDMTMQFFMAWALVSYSIVLKYGFSLTQAVLLGTMTGAAIATKEPAAAAFVALPLAIAALHLRDRPQGSWRRWATWTPFVVAAGSTVAVFGLGSGLFLDPARFFAHLDFVSVRVGEIKNEDMPWVISYPTTLAGHRMLIVSITRYLAWTLTGFGLLLGLAGLIRETVSRQRSALLVLAAATWLAVIFASVRIVQLRYVLPPAFVLAVFAGYTVSSALATKSTAIRRAVLGLACLALALGLLRGINLTFEMLDDSRYQATRWLEETLPAGGRVDFFGPFEKLPHMPEGVVAERAAEFFGAYALPAVDAATVSAIVDRWRRSPPDAILIVPDYLSTPGAETGGSCPPDIYDGLLSGELGYELAATFHSPQVLPLIGRPPLDYPTVNPPIRMFVRVSAMETP